MARVQFVDTAVDGFRVWNILVGKEILDRIVPQFRVQEGQGQQGFDLGGEGEMASVVIEVKRLFTQAIPCKKQAAGSLVPDSDRKHPVQQPQTFRPHSFIKCQQDFGVGSCAKNMAFATQVFPQFLEVVNLAVKYNHIPAGGRHHGLVSCLRQINDAEPAVNKPDFIISPDSPGIWPAVPDAFAHARKPVFMGSSVGCRRRSQKSGQTTHSQPALLTDTGSPTGPFSRLENKVSYS